MCFSATASFAVSGVLVAIGATSLRRTGPRPFRMLALMPLYMVATLAPFFVFSMKVARAIGAVLVIGLATALAMNRGALTSVWCFFAAVISGLLVVALAQEKSHRLRLQSAKTG